MVDLSLYNKFDEPTDVIRIEFPAYGKCFSFLWNSTSPGKLIIEANQSYKVYFQYNIINYYYSFLLLLLFNLDW